MAQFKVGGKVVAIDEGTGETTGVRFTIQIKKGDVFTVLGIKECRCGRIALDVGFSTPCVPGYDNVSECHDCGHKVKTQTWWLRSTLFVPIDETEFKQIEYTKILEQIPACAQ